MAIRQSGLSVRRVYLDPTTFNAMYGGVASCIDHLLSNNAIGPEVEIAHLRDFASESNLHSDSVDQSRHYNRAEIDAVACLQMLSVFENCIEGRSESEDLMKFIFDVGFTAGRTFSS